MIEIQTITVRLGEKDYPIREASHLRASPWRKRLMGEVKPLFDQIRVATGISFTNPADLLQLMPMIESLFVGGIDTIYELLLAYSPDLEADQEYIANYASERQILAAFQEVLKLADPFDMLGQMSRQIGLRMNSTSSSSPSANGDSVSARQPALANGRSGG